MSDRCYFEHCNNVISLEQSDDIFIVGGLKGRPGLRGECCKCRLLFCDEHFNYTDQFGRKYCTSCSVERQEFEEILDKERKKLERKQDCDCDCVILICILLWVLLRVIIHLTPPPADPPLPSWFVPSPELSN